eukprot:CAMPEP_0172362044 /NCGR_PEP_ID=MMETSP1060-20121228/5753_1 /TAXON_ID=37318 /ORGANISM="Pseudo-nitzschia pungens, Strain cf. cingulata" /LENGTH=693 /DNA_ID=CAMNT_0013084463 /DNA_START=236 /DNA_END=2317 /DNA_ORIENTATION=+
MTFLAFSLCSARGLGLCGALRTTTGVAWLPLRSRSRIPGARTRHWFGSGRVADQWHDGLGQHPIPFRPTISSIDRTTERSIFKCYSSRSNRDPGTNRGDRNNRRRRRNTNTNNGRNTYDFRQQERFEVDDDYDYENDREEYGSRNRNRQREPYSERSQSQPQRTREPNQLGRNRYSSDGRKKHQHNNTPRRSHGRGERSRQQQHQQLERRRPPPVRERPPLPPLDSHPTYFTCRHTYESALRQELRRSIDSSYDTDGNPHGIPDNYRDLVSISNPHPGLVVVILRDNHLALAAVIASLRPTYALQVLPDCSVVRAESIKGLANSVLDTIITADDLLPSGLVAAPRGSLAIHALVPEMGRGMPEANLPQYRRVHRIGAEVAAQLQKRCQAARNPRSDSNANTNGDPNPRDRWVLQVLLLEPEVAVASLARCESTSAGPLSSSSSGPTWTWPNWKLPSGLALVELDETSAGSTVPSSAYRKLLEAFWYLGDRPPLSQESQEHPVIDLGACPGGWTGALRRMGCEVVAVDRSPLDPGLMRDEGVEFVQGDAFRFVPPWARSNPDSNKYNNNDDWPGRTLPEPLPNTWMVSDIIAYPDKISELLDHWCGNSWVSHAIVTVKFQAEIPWDELESIRAMVRGHGYHCRTVHFFNNKNEVTLLAVHDGCTNTDTNRGSSRSSFLGKPMYAPVLPPGTAKK